MASTKVIRKVGNHVLLHDVFQGLYRIGDGRDLSHYFDHETKDEIIYLPEDQFLDKAKELLDDSDI